MPSPRQARARATDTDKKTECRDGSDGRQSPGTSRKKDALLAGRPYALLHLHQRVTHAQSDDDDERGCGNTDNTMVTQAPRTMSFSDEVTGIGHGHR